MPGRPIHAEAAQHPAAGLYIRNSAVEIMKHILEFVLYVFLLMVLHI